VVTRAGSPGGRALVDFFVIAGASGHRVCVASLPEAWLAAPPVVVDDRGRPADQPREEEARASGQAALAALYAAHGAAVHRFLCDLLGDRIAAADATQEVFVRAFRRLHALEAPDRPAAWLFGIARLVSLVHGRAQRRSGRHG
jgi:RNA polymerase sigma-70 factor (ECF subfamily)